MRRKLVAAGAALAALALGAAAAGAAAEKPNFTGTWVMDTAKSEGIPSGLEQTVTIKHEGDKLEMVIKQKTPQGERPPVTDNFMLDGQPVDFKPPTPPNQPPPRKPKRVGKWTADGSGVELMDTYEVDTPDGPETIVIKRRWTLSSDGKTLIVEQDVKSPIGSSQARRIYNKQG
jgi:hypothetical protein